MVIGVIRVIMVIILIVIRVIMVICDVKAKLTFISFFLPLFYEPFPVKN